MQVINFEDARGHLHGMRGLPFLPREILLAANVQGTVKGLHKSPYRKVVHVSKGCIHDFYVTKTSEVVERILKTGDWLEIPAEAAHGYFCEKDSTIMYLLEDEFDATKDAVIYWNSPEYAFKHAFLQSSPAPTLIISPKDEAAFYATAYDYLVIGAAGYLGEHVVSTLRAAGKTVFAAGRELRLNDREGIKKAIYRTRAKYIICAAGISGKPTIQWSEEHEAETMETNLLDTCDLIRICRDAGKHLTYLGSALVYNAKEDLARPRCEDEEPDLLSYVYCRYRVMLESIIRRVYMNDVLYLRIIYPCTFDGHPKCFFQKTLGRTASVHDVPVSLTVVPDLFPLLPTMIEDKGAKGIVNFVNDGHIRLPALLNAAGISHNVAEVSSSKVSAVMSAKHFSNIVGDKKVPELVTSITRLIALHANNEKKASKNITESEKAEHVHAS